MIKVTEHSFRVAERLQWKLNSLKEVREKPSQYAQHDKKSYLYQRYFKRKKQERKNKNSKREKCYEKNIRIIMLSVRIHHECHGTDMGRNLGYSSTGCREEQSVIQQYAPLHQTSGEGIIGRRGDTTEAEQHLQF